MHQKSQNINELTSAVDARAMSDYTPSIPSLPTAEAARPARRQLMPDSGFYRECLQASFDELLAAS